MFTNHLKYSNFSSFFRAPQVFLFGITTQQLPVFSICNQPTIQMTYQVVYNQCTEKSVKKKKLVGKEKITLFVKKCSIVWMCLKINPFSCDIFISCKSTIWSKINRKIDKEQRSTFKYLKLQGKLEGLLTWFVHCYLRSVRVLVSVI